MAQQIESRQEFCAKMLKMLTLMESTDTSFFYQIISKSMATQEGQGPFADSLEFPIDFVLQYGETFDKDVTFELEDSEETWPIRLTVHSFMRSKPRVFAYGPGGWKTFLMDNQIKVGDILIFCLISFSRFEVVIGRAPVERHPKDDGNDNENEVNMDIEDEDDDGKSSAKWYRNPLPWWNADQAPVSCRVCKQAPPCPRFVVTIRPSSRTRHLSLAVPGRFWELHGNMLKCNDLQLRGPNKAICKVKAKKIYDVEEEKLTVQLEFGWGAFRATNKLEVGDVLEFSLVGSSCFTVDLVERIEKN